MAKQCTMRAVTWSGRAVSQAIARPEASSVAKPPAGWIRSTS